MTVAVQELRWFLSTLHCRLLLIFTLLLSLGLQPNPSRADQSSLSFAESVRRAPTRMVNLPQNNQTRALLEKYKPILYRAPDSFHPVSFYKDYLPRSVLRATTGEIVERTVSRSDLDEYHLRTGYYLDYQPTPEEALNQETKDLHPTLYGRVYADTVVARENSLPLLFLKYSPVFPYSGLPAGNAWWKEVGSWIAGDPWGWHELDIHGAIYVILDARSRKPLGIMLAQHNYHRIHLRGRDISWPESNRIKISFAVRSNEPYLINRDKGSRYEPTIGDPEEIPALYGRAWFRPISSGYDQIVSPEDGALRVRSRLVMLPHDDPVYTSLMELGEPRKLFGTWGSWFREGPPGMNYYAPPQLKNLADLAAFWDIDATDDRFFRLLEKHSESLRDPEPGPLLRYQRRQFLEDLQSMRKHFGTQNRD